MKSNGNKPREHCDTCGADITRMGSGIVLHRQFGNETLFVCKCMYCFNSDKKTAAETGRKIGRNGRVTEWQLDPLTAMKLRTTLQSKP